MKPIIEQLDKVRLGEPVSHANLTMFPLLGESPERRHYLLMDEAMAAGALKITEVSEDGSVPDLKVKNTADQPVLLIDGEELVGAKQNRIVTITILVPAGAEIMIPVACVEAGRWAHSSPEFMSSNRAQFSRGRASKASQVSGSLARESSAHADQSQVWDCISAKQALMGTHSSTDAMADIFEHYEKTLNACTEAIQAIEGQLGALFAIDGVICGLDLFEHHDALAQMLPKIVRSYAIDAIETAEKKRTGVDHEAASRFVGQAAAAAWKSFPATGAGEWLRVEGGKMAGGALVADEIVLHLCLFPESGGHSEERQSPMVRSRSRGRGWDIG